MTQKLETVRGNRWAEGLRMCGHWVEKLDASGNMGLPDYLVGIPRRGVRWVEAKVRQEEGSAFVPSQVERTQRWWLDQLVLHGARAGVVILGDQGYLELPWHYAQEPIPQQVFLAMALPYRVD